MGSRKRNRDEMESSELAPELSMLDKLRNTWELANLMQYIYIFGKAVKIDEDLTIEVLPLNPAVLQSNICRLPETSQAKYILISGPRDRMPQARTLPGIIRHRTRSSEICIFTSRSYVSSASGFEILLLM